MVDTLDDFYRFYIHHCINNVDVPTEDDIKANFPTLNPFEITMFSMTSSLHEIARQRLAKEIGIKYKDFKHISELPYFMAETLLVYAKMEIKKLENEDDLI